MRSISASIIVLAGTLCFAIGALIRHGDTQLFVCTVGLIIAGAGLFGWFRLLGAPDPSP